MLRKLSSRNRSKDSTSQGQFNMADATPSVLIHGSLSIHIIEARNVEGQTPLSFFSRLERSIVSSVDGVDPYVSVLIGYNKVMQTPVIKNSPCPVWDAKCSFQLCHEIKTVDLRVKAAKRPGPLGIMSKVTHLSMLSIKAQDLINDKNLSGWFPLGPYTALPFSESTENTESDVESDDGKGERRDTGYGEIHLNFQFVPVSEGPALHDVAVPHTYFPLREGIKVSMFQDADSPPGALPPIPFHPDYTHGRCWLEMANAIMSSTGLIYITGWAVWPELVMVRTDNPGDQWKDLTLGEMLIQKADEGVCVCVMVWDELASNRFYNGIMGTHDEEVISYFRRSKVHAIKAGRQNAKEGPLSDLNDAVMFTHHQKTVVVTRIDPESGKHRVEAWVGGLDLTNGRYDNQSHTLFRSLNDGFHQVPDFWQACAFVSAQNGPREPWHDIHSHITGTAAWDVLDNFEGRWKRQASRYSKKHLHEHSVDTFVQPEEEDEIQDGNWNVQLLRSINASSTDFPKAHIDPEDASAIIPLARAGLVVRKSAATEQSIHNAYVHHIRSAKHFIYLENQYFIGSSHMWDSGQQGGFAANLIPIELAEKICAKIRCNQRFMVYLTIPLFPEGPPDSGAVQEILSHQRKSVALITTRVAAALKESDSETSITDWFNVFCLVNRESADGGKEIPGTTIIEKQLVQSRRFMIYIHSKFAIFDDTVAVIGSANINSRSMDGSRDTEIAISAWQPEHVATGKCGYRDDVGEGGDDELGELPKGDVAAFRSSVWSEHLGEYMEEFEQPASLDCIWKIRELAEHNWQHFASDSEEAGGDMPHGHLALYPYEFDDDTGAVSSRQATIPDFPNALVKGKASPGIPNLLTG